MFVEMLVSSGRRRGKNSVNRVKAFQVRLDWREDDEVIAREEDECNIFLFYIPYYPYSSLKRRGIQESGY